MASRARRAHYRRRSLSSEEPDDPVPEPPEGLFDEDAPLDAEPDDPPRDGPPLREEPDIGPGRLLEFPGWRDGLLSTQAGKLKPTESNIIKILSKHPKWHGVVAYNEFSRQLMAMRRTVFDPPKLEYPRQWTDVDGIQTLAWLQGTKGIVMEAGRSAVEHALDVVGHHNAFNPVRDYLRSLKWDGKQRLPSFLSVYFGAEQTPFSSEAGKLWLISAIARIMQPGCQADYMLILEGKQGIGKSTGLKTLFSDEWFTSSRLAIGTDEAPKKLQGKWCQEIAELESFRARAWSEVKQFVTDPLDHYRDSYGRRATDHPRTVVFAGTTNDTEYLGDRTGNRRFWPIMCRRVDVQAISRDRNQIWAEALVRYESGERWHMEDETLAREEQRKREQREPWFELVQEWLRHPTIPVENGRQNISPSKGFTQAHIMAGALGMRPVDMTQQNQQKLGWVLSKLKLERKRIMVDGAREYRYFMPGTKPDSEPPA